MLLLLLLLLAGGCIHCTGDGPICERGGRIGKDDAGELEARQSCDAETTKLGRPKGTRLHKTWERGRCASQHTQQQQLWTLRWDYCAMDSWGGWSAGQDLTRSGQIARQSNLAIEIV